jgi:hypothetical protein
MDASPSSGWQSPAHSPEEIIEAYLTTVRPIAGVRRGWVQVSGNDVHFDTEVEDNSETERQLYRAELELIDRFGPDCLSFDVYRLTAVPEHLAATSRLVLTT